MATLFEQFQRNRQLGINQGTSRTVQQTGPVTTEEGLKTNPQWIADSKLIYQNETGKRWRGTDEDVAEWNLNKQSKVGWNLTSAGLHAFEAQDWRPEVKQAWYRSLDSYGQTDITLRSAGRAAFWSIFDLPTLATFGWGAVAKAVGGKAAGAAVRYSFKEALKKSLTAEAKAALKKRGSDITEAGIKRQIQSLGKNELLKRRKEVAKQVAFRNAVEQFAPAGAIYSGLFDLTHQDLESDVDPNRPDFDYKRFATAVFAGGVLGGGFGYITPRIGEKIGRSKFLREALESESTELGDNLLPPNQYGLEKGTNLEDRLAREAGNPKLQESKETYEVAEEIIKAKQKEKGRTLNVIDEGTGKVKKTKRGTLENQQEIEFLPNVERLKKNTGAKVEGSDLLPNETRSKQNKYMPKNKKGKGDQDAIIMSNIAGRYTDKVLFNAVLRDKAKSLADDGTLIINLGPRKKEKVAVDILEEDIIPLSQRETKGISKTKDKKGKIEFEEKPIKGTEGKKRIREEFTGLSEKDLAELLGDNFKTFKAVKKNGKTVFIAKDKIKFRPNIKRFKKPHRSLFEKIFKITPKQVGNRFKSSAGLPEQLEAASAKKRGAMRAAGVRIEQDFYKLRTALQKFYTVGGKALQDLTPEEHSKVLDKVNEATFMGNKQAFDEMPEQVQTQILAMRRGISELQKRLMPKTAKNPEGSGYILNKTDLHKEIKSQIDAAGKPDMAMYVNRQYEVFDNPEWLEKLVEVNPDAIHNAKTYFLDRLRYDKNVLQDISLGRIASEYRAAKKAQEAGKATFRKYSTKKDFTNESVDEAINRIEGEEIDSLIKSFLGKYSGEELQEIKKLGFDGFMANQTTGSARVKGAFFVRKDIPPAIRELMGEYKDPFVNYANTVLKLMQNYENFKFEEAVRKLVEKGKFPGVRIAPGSQVGTDLLEASALTKYRDDVQRPLRDLRADEIIFDAIKQGNELQPLMNTMLKPILAAQALTRISKTAYAFSAYPRNFAGAMLKAFAAGNLNLGNIKTFTKVWKGLRSFSDDEIAAETEKLTYLDIHGSGANIGSIREALDEAVNPNWWTDVSVMLGRGDRLTTPQRLKANLKNFNNKVLNVYQAMDDMWKWYSFENEKRNYKQILLDKYLMSGKQEQFNPDRVTRRYTTAGGKEVKITVLDEYAGKMVRAHMDNYGNVSRAIKATRRLPLADFLAYKTEQVRTTWNIVETAFRDIKNGRAALKATNGQYGNAELMMGYKRLGSVISAVSLPTALGATMVYSYGNMGAPAEIQLGGKTYQLPYTKEDGLREAALPDYATGDEYIFIPGLQPKDGKDLRLFNISYIDPWAPLRAPILALLRGGAGDRDFDEAIKKGAKDSFTKIIETFGESMLFEAAMGAAYGRDQFGNRISRQDETMTAKSFERLMRLVSVFEPGAVRDLRKVYNASQYGYTEKGAFKTPLPDTLIKSVGVPIQYVEPKKSLYFKVQPILKRWNAAGDVFYDATGSYYPKSEDQLVDAYKTALEREYRAANDLARLFYAAKATGMDFNDIYKAITRDAIFPERFNKKILYAAINNGKFIPSTMPIKKSLIRLKRHVESISDGKQKVKILDVQKKLNQIYSSYVGIDFSINSELVEKEKE